MKIEPGEMIKFFPDKIEGEKFFINHIELDEEAVKREQLRSAFNPWMYREIIGLKPGKYTRLVGPGGIMMSDTPMEINTNREFICVAHGNILIGGLGLGIILLLIQDKEEVETVTVIELEQEVIDLVIPKIPLNKKITIIQGDILEWRPKKGALYDVIYFDIWNDICSDNNKDMVKLNRTFWRYLNKKENPNAWMYCWRQEDVRRLTYGY